MLRVRLVSALNVPIVGTVPTLTTPKAVLLALILIAACSRADAPPKQTTESAAGTAVDSSADSDADENRLDPGAAAAQSLLRELADRDEALLEMARMAIGRREQLQVSSDARRILTEQRRESNRLLGMLKGEYRLTHKPRISVQDQPLIDSLNGAGVGDFDPIFLRVVATHHEDDAQIIERALPGITPKIRATVSEIRAQRLSEAAAFKKRLAAPASRR